MKQICIAATTILLTACQQAPVQQSSPVAEQSALPVEIPTVAPEVNNSADVPDCMTAGERISSYVEVGMPKAEVRRLVGKPVKDTGSTWGWARGAISYPGVRFQDGLVRTYGADTSACK